VWRHFPLRIHTNTYPVLSAVLLQLFTPRNHLQLCGRKHFASAMEIQYIWQPIVHQHLHYNQHQHCFLIYVILLHVKILSDSFLGVFAKLRKASISFIMSVRPSVRPPARLRQSHWEDFHEICPSRILRNFDEKIQLTLKYEKKNNGHCTWRCIYIYGKWWERLQTNVLEKIQKKLQVQALLPKSCLVRNTEK